MLVRLVCSLDVHEEIWIFTQQLIYVKVNDVNVKPWGLSFCLGGGFQNLPSETWHLVCESAYDIWYIAIMIKLIKCNQFRERPYTWPLCRDCYDLRSCSKL